jgi:hypothetical protein
VIDEQPQVVAVDGGVTEAVSFHEPVRVQAAAADPHHRALQARLGKRVKPDLPGHSRRVIEGVVEAVRHDFEAGVGGALIGGAERVELLDRAIGIDHDQRARQQPEPLHVSRIAENELDHLAEQANPRLLPGRCIPALEHADEPLPVFLARRARVVVSVR